ncbi:hypothetical protein HOP50_12g65520 [Chloropicon primus]|uniref:NADH dehydrogenase [ubiquinone] iron-sulfur protein 5 n=1 Tax=Chloropicon primus TaxID=1764295 RepID=A0A5B8MWR0_9CHLO|nr:hypothetical protein A3770_12p65300 [Chloropicon primus]UPR03224.1 hypothetical protein HOP50_12g65520 [Chloropicon primus]|eukprot:QDZ24012.1 hypothetical protein A3770_12p65300 [Chloropicon primus]
MASGFGITGQQGRCYPIWMDFYGCMMETDQPSKCAELREDYFECLHHRKEIGRFNRIGQEIAKQEAQGESPLTSAPTPSTNPT